MVPGFIPYLPHSLRTPASSSLALRLVSYKRMGERADWLLDSFAYDAKILPKYSIYFQETALPASDARLYGIFIVRSLNPAVALFRAFFVTGGWRR